MASKFGEIEIKDGYVFHYTITNDRVPEVNGWVTKDCDMIKGSYGFYRTDDPDKAAKIAENNLYGDGLLT